MLPDVSVTNSPGATVNITIGGGQALPEKEKKKRRTARPRKPKAQKSAWEQLREAALEGAKPEVRKGAARLAKEIFDGVILSGKVTVRALAAAACYLLWTIASLSPELSLALAWLCFEQGRTDSPNGGDNQPDEDDGPDGNGEVEA